MTSTFPKGGVGTFWSFNGLWIFIIESWLQVATGYGEEESWTKEITFRVCVLDKKGGKDMIVYKCILLNLLWKEIRNNMEIKLKDRLLNVLLN